MRWRTTSVVVALLVATKAAQFHVWPDPGGTRMWPGLVRQSFLIGALLLLLVRRHGLRRAASKAGLAIDRRGAAALGVLGGSATMFAIVGAPPTLSLMNLVVVTALGEEILFRGLLPPLLSDRDTTAGADWTCSIAFGLWHLPDVRMARPLEAIAILAFTTGAAHFILSPLRRRTGSVYAPAAIHALANGVALLLFTGW